MLKSLCFAFVSLALAVNAHTQNQPSVKDAYKQCFMVGAALNPAQFTGQDEAEDAIIERA